MSPSQLTETTIIFARDMGRIPSLEVLEFPGGEE